MYLAAHPDDENTRMIAYFSNQEHARTCYLSLTRGDGGQNLVGPELREALGVIRTQELLEARKIDGGQQFFTRANDFGFSKNPTETFQNWNRDQVLFDVVRLIRQFKPDIIINRFDHRSPGTTHGHHTASAQLSVEAFDLAADPTFHPELGAAWQVGRQFFNTSWWFYGSKEKFEKADKTQLMKVSMGDFYPELGQSNQEIAALSRSKHQSQGFGTAGARGEDFDYLEWIKGAPLSNKQSIFEGLKTQWNRVEGGEAIAATIQHIIAQYDFKNPAASVPELILAHQKITQLKDAFWRNIKLKEVEELMLACAGMHISATTSTPHWVPGNAYPIKIEVVNRAAVDIQWTACQSNWIQSAFTAQILSCNRAATWNPTCTPPAQTPLTNPYWLNEPFTIAQYQVSDPLNIGKPETSQQGQVGFTFKIGECTFSIVRPILYQYTDDVKGEIYQPLILVPAVRIHSNERNVLFPSQKARDISFVLLANQDNQKGEFTLKLPAGWKAKPESISFSLAHAGEEQQVQFSIYPPEKPAEGMLEAQVIMGSTTLSVDQQLIQYPHIPTQCLTKAAQIRLIYAPVATKPFRVAYIMGAGDEVPAAMKQLGLQPILIEPDKLTMQQLASIDVVVTGIRAYNVVLALKAKQPLLLEWVKNGGHLIVQYNTLDDFVTPTIAPFSLKIARDRVTEEKSEVVILNPEHPILNTPNRITSVDFKDWKQEFGLYFPSEWDPAFTPLLSMNDQGESAKKGSLLVADYGKGTYIYTGLSFFRELPEGVVGAYRLWANLLAYKK